MKKKALAKRLKREHVINKAQGRVIHRMTLQISQLTVMVDELKVAQERWNPPYVIEFNGDATPERLSRIRKFADALTGVGRHE